MLQNTGSEISGRKYAGRDHKRALYAEDRKEYRRVKEYQRLERKRISELDTEAVVYRHKKSGARVLTLQNQDKNKVFSISFRTPAEDSTGVSHITEHSVLCGSEKFPLKDPFIELVKGSLNTYLNAMTYPDKTVYPVASTNDKDFDNLMDVYLDAVFHPNCRKNRFTFLQEGWHYETVNEGAELRYSGVVYNEMRGAFSNPESVLERRIMHSLFPKSCYGNESGGDPEAIPDLSYENFCAFHERFYHPSNSYIILYGDLDMEAKLRFLDREYLSGFDAIDPLSEIRMQESFPRKRREEDCYPIGKEEKTEGRSYLAYSMVLKDALDPKRSMAYSILDYALLSAPGAALKQALLDAGIGEDILGGYAGGILQPYFSVIAKNTDPKKERRFQEIIRGTLRKLAEEGIDKKTLLSAINHDEFLYREADYGRTPKGLVYSLSALDSWLYGGEPWRFLDCGKLYGELRSLVEKGYFESLLRESFLDQKHASLVLLRPEAGLSEKREAELSAKLRAFREGLSEAELRKIRSDEEALLRYQEEKNTEEALRSLPLLSREDIGREAERSSFRREEVSGRSILLTELPSRGILYLRLNFNTACLTEEELPYAGFLKSALAYMDTEKHNFRDLASELYLNTGDYGFDMEVYPDLEDPLRYRGFFAAECRILPNQIEKALSLLEEILHTTKLEDPKRMLEILNECRSRERMSLENASHSYAVRRASSGFSAAGRYRELSAGIEYYRFLERSLADFEEKGGDFMRKLSLVAEKLFETKNLFLSAASEKGELEKLLGLLPDWLSEYERREREQSLLEKILSPGTEREEKSGESAQLSLRGAKREGFCDTAQVNFVSQCGRFDRKRHPYSGALRVLKNILNFEYLWKRLRERGNAYGCMSGFSLSGEGYLVSYRDPHIRSTMQVYAELPDYLRSFRSDERGMMKYIIGAVSELDAPKTNYARAMWNLSCFLSHITDEMLQREREELLDTTEERIRSFAPYIEEILSTGAACTIGSAAKVSGAGDLFESVEKL